MGGAIALSTSRYGFEAAVRGTLLGVTLGVGTLVLTDRIE